MFSKTFTVLAIVLAVSLQARSHALIAPVLGVSATPQRSDVQRPSTASPCGKTNIAANIDTSMPVMAAADGTFKVTATSFNGGADGSLQVAMTVDATGTGKTFVAGTVPQNGPAAPPSATSVDISASLPSGTKCTGGKSGNLCLVSFKTTAGFGNCVVVQQGTGSTPTSNSTLSSSVTAASGATATGKTTATGGATKSCSAKKRAEAAPLKARFYRVGGTLAPRALRADLEARKVALV